MEVYGKLSPTGGGFKIIGGIRSDMSSYKTSLPDVISSILEVVMDNGGTVKDRELYEVLRKKYEISYPDFLRYLMMLEIRGYVTVSSTKEDVRVVSLTRYAKDILSR